jgi:hypothetical protein
MENAGAAVDSLWFDVLFGQDISLAVLATGFDTGSFGAKDMASFTEAVVAVSRPSQPALVLESLGSMFGAELSVETLPYEQWEINKLTLENGPPIFYALTDGLMITALSATPVEDCLRQSLDRQTSLLAAEKYQRHCAGLYDPDQTTLMAYADGQTLLDFVRETMEKEGASDAEIRQIEKMRGLESMNLVQYDDGGDQVTSRVVVGLDRTNMSPYLARTLASAPGSNRTMARIPTDALLYGWQNTFDLSLFWEEIQSDPGMTADALSQFEAGIYEKTGETPASLSAAFGSQAGVLINDVNMEGFFPIPELALFVEVVQPEVVDGVIGNLVGQIGLPIQEERYNDIDLHYVSLPLGESLSPAYAVSDGFCTLTVSRSLLKAMLDAPATGSLPDHPYVKALGGHLTSESNSAYYMRAEGMIEKIRGLLDWGMTWMAMTQPDKAENLQQIVSLGVSPLLDGLSVIQAVGGHAVIEEDRVVSEVRVLLDR